MHLSFQLGTAYEKANQGQNVTEFNTLVGKYNAWIRQHFGEDANLFMSKINATMPNATMPNETMQDEIIPNEIAPIKTMPNEIIPNETTSSAGSPGLRDPFKAGSDLSQFGKQQVPAF
jgi:hypothetical protein